VSAAPQRDVRDRRFTLVPMRVDVVPFQEPPLRAPAGLADERTPTAIAFPHLAANVSGDAS